MLLSDCLLNDDRSTTGSDLSTEGCPLSRLRACGLPLKKTKVQLCRNFLDNNYCPYGARCCFAHGYEQLCANTEQAEKLKTKPCRMFHSGLYCRFGERCNFIHEGRTLSRMKRFVGASKVNIISQYPQLLLLIRKPRSFLDETPLD